MSLPIQRALLVLVFLLFAVLQVRWTFTTLRFVLAPQDFPSDPADVDPVTLALTSITSPEMKEAGAKVGDVVLAEDGTPVHSYVEVGRFFFRHAAGNKMSVRLRRGNSQPFDISFRLPPRQKGALDYVAPIALNILTPWFCLVLGFLVAFKRTGDPVAYALLALLLCLSLWLKAEAGVRMAWGTLFTWPMFFIDQLSTLALPFAWLCFALLFPEPRSRHKIMPWAAWIFGIPYIVYAVVMAAASAALLHSSTFQWYPGAERAERLRRWMEAALTAFFILLGFANFLNKWFRETDLTVRRRLRWMLFGMTLGLVPVSVMVAIATLMKRDINALPAFILMPIVLTPFPVPLTLAYAVLVDRLFDVGLFLRQGLLAAKTVTIVRVVLVAALVLLALQFEQRRDIGNLERWIMTGSCIVAALLLRRLADWTRRWVDRRFFQEAVNTEQLLAELSQQVRRIADPELLLRTVTERVAAAMHLSRVAALIPSNGAFVPAYETGWGAAAIPETVVRQVRDSRTPLAVPDGLVLPISTGGELHGILSLGPKRSEEPYSATDIRLLESVANQTALALENSRLTAAVAKEAAHRERIHSELEIARQVQQRLFPKSAPHIAGLEVAGQCRPAQSVGGDYFDFLVTPGGAIGFAIGDVAGKGVPAALLMAGLQASLRGLVLAGICEPADLLTKLNQLVYDATPSNRFATFFYGLYDPGSRSLRYSAAGHNPALLFRAGEEAEWLKTRGVGLGLTRGSRYEQAETVLNNGDCLVLYTDGITEARAVSQEEFGEQRLVEIVRRNRRRSAAQILNCVIEETARFSAGAPQFDDLTLIVVKVCE